MKNTIKILTILAFITFCFTACHKEPNNIANEKTHRVRYEIISNGEKEANLSLVYITQKGEGDYNGMTVEKEKATTPWIHEFTIYKAFTLSLFADSENENIYERVPIKAYIYVDDELITEQESDQYFNIDINYFYNN